MTVSFLELLSRNIAITGVSVRLDFPANMYMVNEPVTMVTVLGGETNVDVTSPPEFVAGYGEVHTHVLIEFQAGVVGLRANVLVLKES